MFDLSTLPPPKVLSEPVLEAIFARDLVRFKELSPEYAYFLASDPVTKVVGHGSWREFILRLYINNVARARLLAFATEGDLDQLALAEGVERMLVDEGNAETNPPVPATYESDARLRDRILAKIAGRNGAGTVPWYRFHAMSADARVKDVNVYSPDFPDGYNMGGRVTIAVMSFEDTGIPSIDLLERVNFAVRQPKVKAISDLLSVEAARPVNLALQATVYLKQTAPIDVFNGLAQIFHDAFDAEIGLGADITMSWITKTLAVDGVYDVVVTSPDASVKVDPSQFPYLATLNLSFGGFDKLDDYKMSNAERSSIYDRVYRYYFDSCVKYLRSAQQIAADLNKVAKEGVIQPTTEGFARWLGLDNVIINAVTGILLPEDEIAFLIREALQPAYDAIARTTT